MFEKFLNKKTIIGVVIALVVAVVSVFVAKFFSSDSKTSNE